MLITWDKLASAIIIGGIGWLSLEIHTVKTDVAVNKVKLENVEVKVAQNHALLMNERLADADIPRTNIFSVKWR